MYATYQRKKKTFDAPQRQCNRCRGTGRAPCQFCGGSGVVVKKRDFYGKPIQERCDACFGNKMSKCFGCGGVGRV